MNRHLFLSKVSSFCASSPSNRFQLPQFLRRYLEDCAMDKKRFPVARIQKLSSFFNEHVDKSVIEISQNDS